MASLDSRYGSGKLGATFSQDTLPDLPVETGLSLFFIIRVFRNQLRLFSEARGSESPEGFPCKQDKRRPPEAHFALRRDWAVSPAPERTTKLGPV